MVLGWEAGAAVCRPQVSERASERAQAQVPREEKGLGGQRYLNQVR